MGAVTALLYASHDVIIKNYKASLIFILLATDFSINL